MRRAGSKHGLLMIYTGHGKGKTTAALGTLLRASGWNMRVVMFQFIKSTNLNTGEHRAARRLGLDIRALGTGFTWKADDTAEMKELAVEQWRACQQAALSGQLDMIIMDEISYPINNGWIDLSDVTNTIQRRPSEMHVLLTGRDMPAQLMEMADLVTEIKEIKHHYQQGIKAQKGIEY